MKRCPFCAEEIQDAAIVCRFCGRDLSPPPTPIQRGPAPTDPKRNQANAMLWLFGTSAAVVVFAMILAAIGRSSRSTSASPARVSEELNPSIGGSNAFLTLHNPSRVAWRETKLHVNDTFVCMVGTVGAYQTTTVRMRDCTRPDGTRFSPIAHKVTKIQTEAIVGDDYSPTFKTKRFQ